MTSTNTIKSFYIIAISYCLVILGEFFNLSIFTNTAVDADLLQAINKDFTKFIFAFIGLVFIVFTSYLYNFKIYKIFDNPIIIIFLIEGLNIVLNSISIISPSKTNFNWSNLSHYNNSINHVLVVVGILYLIITILKFRSKPLEDN